MSWRHLLSIPARFKVELMSLNHSGVMKCTVQAQGRAWQSCTAFPHSPRNVIVLVSDSAMLFTSAFYGLLFRLSELFQEFKNIYICVYVGVCVSILMGICMYISYPWPWKTHSTLYGPCFIRQGKGFKIKAWNPYQLHSAVSFRYKLQTFFALLWYYKTISKSLSNVSQRQRMPER